MRFTSETEFVQKLQQLARSHTPGLLAGIGDDAALFESTPGYSWCITTDLLIEGVHFNLSIDTPDSVGHKALAAGLSDLAAMGATPRFALVSIAVPRAVARAFLPAFFRGLLRLARRYNVALIGGDTSRAIRGIFLDVVALGSVRKNHAIRRSGATAGDAVFVTGQLGKSAYGLELLQKKRVLRSRVEKLAVQSHLYPAPRTGMGIELSARKIPSAMIDISDGLSTDLSHLCDESGVGAEIFLGKIPLLEDRRRSKRLQQALSGGEDYELLFTVPPENWSKLKTLTDRASIHEIGRIVPKERGVRGIEAGGIGHPLAPSGWDHFR